MLKDPQPNEEQEWRWMQTYWTATERASHTKRFEKYGGKWCMCVTCKEDPAAFFYGDKVNRWTSEISNDHYRRYHVYRCAYCAANFEEPEEEENEKDATPDATPGIYKLPKPGVYVEIHEPSLQNLINQQAEQAAAQAPERSYLDLPEARDENGDKYNPHSFMLEALQRSRKYEYAYQRGDEIDLILRIIIAKAKADYEVNKWLDLMNSPEASEEEKDAARNALQSFAKDYADLNQMAEQKTAEIEKYLSNAK